MKVDDVYYASANLERPIGVFDSGVGGLTVLKALRAKMPHQDFIYLGDTARVPYGRKPKEMVEQFAYGISHFLRDQGVQAVVIACNTASAAALPQLRDKIDLPIWGVIKPGVEAARRITRSGHIGVIGTKGTVNSGAYQRRLEALGLTVWAQACPMFVHLVEEGLIDSPEANVLAQLYLSDLAQYPTVDTLILGCTHYPMLKAMVARVVGAEVQLVDSAEVTAEEVWHALSAAAVSPSTQRVGKVLHFVTGDPVAYQHTAQVIGGVEGQIVSLDVNVLARYQHTEVLR